MASRRAGAAALPASGHRLPSMLTMNGRAPCPLSLVSHVLPPHVCAFFAFFVFSSAAVVPQCHRADDGDDGSIPARPLSFVRARLSVRGRAVFARRERRAAGGTRDRPDLGTCVVSRVWMDVRQDTGHRTHGREKLEAAPMRDPGRRACGLWLEASPSCPRTLRYPL